MTREAFGTSTVYSSSEAIKFYKEKDISKVVEEGFSSFISLWNHQFEQFFMHGNNITRAKENIWKATPGGTRQIKVSQKVRKDRLQSSSSEEQEEQATVFPPQEVRKDRLQYSPWSLGRVQKGHGRWHTSCCFVLNEGIKSSCRRTPTTNSLMALV